MTNLSKHQAEEYLSKAWSHVAKYSLGSYRLGQALWNILPKELIQGRVGTEADFYHEMDSNVVTVKFYQYYVGE